jgi:hypothetical protein
VKKLWAWLAGGAGGVAAYRTLKRRPPEPVPVPDTRVDELRAMLAEKREQPASEDADSRRRAVHEQARAAIDEMLGE